MPRSITSAMLTAMTSPSWSPVIFCQLTFNSGAVYLSTLYSAITTSLLTGAPQLWEGLGPLLSIGNLIEDGATVDARGIVIEISGLDPVLLPDIQNDVQLGLPVTVWLGALAAGALVDSPVVLWSGGMDQPSITVSAETASISVNCEDLLISLNVPIDRRLTQQDQTMNWSGDLGLNFVDSIQQKNVTWGTSVPTPNI